MVHSIGALKLEFRNNSMSKDDRTILKTDITTRMKLELDRKIENFRISSRIEKI